MTGGMRSPRYNGSSPPTCHDDTHTLSKSASMAFWLTGVACVSADHLQPVSSLKEEADGKDAVVKQGEEEERHEQACDRNGNGEGRGTMRLASLTRTATGTVAWLREERRLNGSKGNNSTDRDGGIHKSSTSSASKVPVHVVDETVMCNLVPLLPRTHARFGLVSQIVPCTLWPLPVDDAPTTARAISLQHAAALASELHYDSLRGLETPTNFLSSPTASLGAVVEWHSGGVGYTTDTEGLWEEQRLVRERYYHLPPFFMDDDVPHTASTAVENAGGGSGDGVDDLRQRVVRLRTPPSTLTGAVREQLHRFRRLQQERLLKKDRSEWVLCFARLVTITYELAAVLEQLTTQRDIPNATPMATSTHSLSLAATDTAGCCCFCCDYGCVLPTCDALLDEIFLIGIVPNGEPHRLSLVSPSEAHRIMVEQQRQTHASVDDGGGNAAETTAGTTEPQQAIAESLMELMISALRESLCRRICVQYELLRILRVKGLAEAHRDLLLQYSRWYTSVPTPMAVLHVFAGSTLFAPLVAQRWPHRSAPRSGVMNPEAGVKRKRAEDEEDGDGVDEEDDVEEKSNRNIEEEEGDEEEEEKPHSTSPSRNDEGLNGVADVVMTTPTMDVPFEMDLLDVDYPARFAAWMRRHGGSHHSINNNAGSSGGGSSSNHGGNIGGGCDEGTLTATVGWLRRHRRTMTLKEIGAFARKKH
ncbi:hypothetical protein MOQ_005677 [Trypanosoma cruzi marinkellei]|uniref:Uncharacterized protein n=1 Tax=Trypanosoma cruzi marinkellei TaxID=85056 RepID=K2MXI5_TRYCR|nr:hypothetical protein MOQ_005677 [Trypanosoma cruzi marinkellei]